MGWSERGRGRETDLENSAREKETERESRSESGALAARHRVRDRSSRQLSEGPRGASGPVFRPGLSISTLL